jgi:hypothetical protein
MKFTLNKALQKLNKYVVHANGFYETQVHPIAFQADKNGNLLMSARSDIDLRILKYLSHFANDTARLF